MRLRAIITTHLAILLTLSSLIPRPVLAQGDTGQWRAFTNADGLVDNRISAILQDRRGVLWIGTEAGLSRYDGLFTTVTEVQALSSGVNDIFEAQDGSLWLGTNMGLVHFEPSTANWQVYTKASGLASDIIQSIATDADGQTWIATPDGVSYWDAGSGTWKTLRTSDGLASDNARTVVLGPDRAMWIATDKGVSRYSTATGEWSYLTIEQGLISNDVRAIAIGDDGTLWFGTADGVSQYSPFSGRWRHFTSEHGLGANMVLSIHVDSLGHLWLGTNSGGVSHYDPQAEIWETFTTNDGLSANFVRDIAEDRDGGLWFATPGGLSLYTGRAWTIAPVGDVGFVPINSLVWDDHQSLWVATHGYGVWQMSSEGWIQHSTSTGALLSDTVWTLYKDSRGGIWAGTEGGGLSYWDGTRWLTFTKADGLAENYVTTIKEGPDGRIWVGTTQGLSVATRQDWAWETIGGPEDADVLTQRINAIIIVSSDEAWIGTDGAGICHLVSGHCSEVYTTADGLASNRIATGAAITDDKGGLWFGHWRGGVSHWDGRQWKVFGPADGLAADSIYSLYLASDGSLWIGTLGGLSRFDGRSWQTYTRLHGLASNEVNAIVEGPDGRLWFGTRAGLTIHRPERSSPWVRIETVNGRIAEEGQARFSVSSINIAALGEREVSVLDGDLTITYRGGDLWTGSRDLVYIYRLRGNSDEWAETTDMVHMYQGLPAGTYTFEVAARDLDFNYSPVDTLTIKILPPGSIISVPILGPVPVVGFGILAALTLLAVVGIGYGTVTYYNTRSRPRQALQRKYNPYISGEPIRRPDMFFGREELLRRILQILHSNSIMIHGERRIGKTTMLHQIAHQLRNYDDPEYHYVPIYMDLEGTPQEIFFHTLMAEIVAGVSLILPNRPPLQFDQIAAKEYTDREFVVDLREILNALREQDPTRQVRLILLMDEMDVMNDYDSLIQQQLRRIFMQTFAQNLGAVVAGIQISKEWDRVESPWYNLFNEIALEPFTPEQARALIEEPVRGVYRWDKEAVEFVIDKSEGRPHRIQQLCLEAVNQMIEARRTRITLQDARQAFEIVQRNQRD